MDVTEQQYIIEGVIYNIITTSEMHKRIRNDNDFALQYVCDNTRTSQLEFQSGSDIENNSNIENISTSESDANNATMEHSGTWQNSAIKLLFCLYKDHLTLFKNDKIRNEIVWRKIGDGLKEKGYLYTIKQIENKWKNLRKSYIKVKDHNSKSGASLKKCKYYDDMEEIYGKSHSVLPVATASNLSQKVLSPSTDEERNSDEDSNVVVPPPKKSKMEKQLHVLTEYMDKNAEEKERRHKERLDSLKEAVDTYKDLMNKLLKKL